MHSVHVTGVGIISSIGLNIDTVTRSLKSGKSGLTEHAGMAELGFRCQVYGTVEASDFETIPRRSRQTMSTAATYAVAATQEALENAGLSQSEIQNDRTGVIVGTAFGGLGYAAEAQSILMKRKNPKRAGGTSIVKAMNSTASGNLAAFFGVQGRAYSISSAFTTGVDNIGHAYELISSGVQDICICGSAEGEIWQHAGISFETNRALSSGSNDDPAKACRPYDQDRAGIVLSEGAGILILESAEHMKARNGKPIAELIAYATANDGDDMFRPSGKGLKRVLTGALGQAQQSGVTAIDYLNSHATGTVIGDAMEAQILAGILGEQTWVSSTKGQTGHGMGAAGAQEAVYTLLMLQNGFMAPTANLNSVDEACSGIRHVRDTGEVELNIVATISSGFGGSNGCLMFKKLTEAVN